MADFHPEFKMKSLGFVLLIFGLIYHANCSSLRIDDRDASHRILFRQLLDDQSTDLSTSDKIEDLKAQIQSELDHMNVNTRSYLASIRMALMNFACRIGLTRFCITNDLPVLDDLPEVPAFPNDWPTRAPTAQTGMSSSKEEGAPAPKPENLTPEPAKAPAAESKPEAPKSLVPSQV